MTAALFVIAFALFLVALGLFSLAYGKTGTRPKVTRLDWVVGPVEPKTKHTYANQPLK